MDLWKPLVVAELLYLYATAPILEIILENKLRRKDLFALTFATGSLLPLYAYASTMPIWLIPIIMSHLMVALMVKEEGWEFLFSPYPYLLGASLMSLIYIRSVVVR
ncbi:hypothetical protein EYM_03475 [Ignicoccus islandicus DSM 13165]|uniref:Uncharacterized protein n=1 Tax=Ignicoccus islandicus DSM 13165 TaxID=940295 RepID=A0A0U3FQ41_9CREN|nr:hypothetical protein [Ignicoccus islandicus]ALU12415.1 hypothetical protein EYM_03475 [Ignicoccus islandicus DSM 13165]